MSTTLYESTSLQVTRFYGGEERGTCVQIDVDGYGYVQLTLADAAKLAEVLAGWLRSDVNDARGTDSLELRDLFASKALGALIATDCWTIESAPPGEDAQPEHVAREAYLLADAMLKARAA